MLKFFFLSIFLFSLILPSPFLLGSECSCENCHPREIKPRALCNPNLLTLGAGVFKPAEPSGIFLIEYKNQFLNLPWLRPQIGLITESFDSVYVYAGFALDFPVADCFRITPSFSPGIYFRGNGKNLGFPIEFRSGIEFAFVLKSQTRLGTQFFHISNAHLSSRNPGVNAIVLFISFPWGY